MNILFVAGDLADAGGVNRVISRLAQGLHTLPNIRLSILHAASREAPYYDIPQDVELVPFNNGLCFPRAFGLIRSMLFARNKKFDVVISFWAQENIFTSLSFLSSGTRIILCEHFCYNEVSPVVRFARRFVYRFANDLLVLNRRELVYYRHLGIPARLAPNPAIPSNWICVREWKLKSRIILGVGHLIRRKGFEYLVRAAKLADVGGEGWCVKIVGSGPEYEPLMALISRLGVESFVEILPPTKAIEKWYSASRIIVVPSLSEVFSMVIPEAMAHGVIPIAFDADGPREILHSHLDLLVPMADIQALAAKIRTFMAVESAEDLVSSLKREAVNKYSLEAVSRFWATLLGEHSSSVSVDR